MIASELYWTDQALVYLFTGNQREESLDEESDDILEPVDPVLEELRLEVASLLLSRDSAYLASQASTFCCGRPEDKDLAGKKRRQNASTSGDGPGQTRL